MLYRIRGDPGSAKVSTIKALPHRAFDLPEVVKFASDRLAEFNTSPTSGRECFGEWDVVKSKVKNFAQHTWEVHVKARGANLDKLKTARNRAEDNLNESSFSRHVLTTLLAHKA